MSVLAVKGFQELGVFLTQLPVKMEQNILRGALRAGANVIRAAVKSNIPRKTGELSRSLRVSVRARHGVVTALVKVDAFPARFIEFGVRPHSIVKRRKKLVIDGKFVGTVVKHPGLRSRPFLRPAADSNARNAALAVGEYIKRRLAIKNGLDTSGIDVA